MTVGRSEASQTDALRACLERSAALVRQSADLLASYGYVTVVGNLRREAASIDEQRALIELGKAVDPS
jgi:hypothetical protein